MVSFPAIGSTITLNEPWTNFEGVRVSAGNNTREDHYYTEISPSKPCFHCSWGYNWVYETYVKFTPTSDPKIWTYDSNIVYYFKNTDTTITVVQNDTTDITSATNFKIVGINRIAGGN